MQTNPKDITEMRSIHPHPHSWRFLFRYHIVFGKMSTKTQNRIKDEMLTVRLNDFLLM